MPLLPWHVYIGLPAVAVILAIASVRGLGGQWKIWRRLMGVAAVLLILVTFSGSPLLRSYPWIRVASDLQDAYFARLNGMLRGCPDQTERLAPGPMPLFVHSQEGFSGGTMFVAPYTIQAWIDILYPDVLAVVQDPIASVPAPVRHPLSAGTRSVRRCVIESEIEFIMVDKAGEITDRATVHWLPRGILKQIVEPVDDVQLRALIDGARDHPADAEAWFALGQAHLGRNELPEAETALTAAVGLRPYFLQARLSLVVVYMKYGLLHEAAAELRAVLEIQPGHERAERALALVEDTLRRLEESPRP
jgi:hypothetical protein